MKILVLTVKQVRKYFIHYQGLDGWDKMMSIYLSSDWPYFSRVRKGMDISVKNSLEYRDSLHSVNYKDEIRYMLKRSGPLSAAKIDLGSTGKGS